MDSTNHDLPGAGTPGEPAGADDELESRRGPLGWNIFDPEFKWLLNAPPRLIIMAINGILGRNYSLRAEVQVDFTDDTILLFMLSRLSHVNITITELDPDTGKKISDTFVVQSVPRQDSILSFRVSQSVYKGPWMHPWSAGGYAETQSEEAVELFLYEGTQEHKETEISVVRSGTVVRTYPMPTIRFLQRDFETNAAQLLPLLPFEVLRYRDELKEDASEERIEKLKKHINAIDSSLKDAGARQLLSGSEVEALRGLMIRLYNEGYDFLASKGVRLLPADPEN